MLDILCRASQGEKVENTFDSQVLQYEPAHYGSINTVTNLSPDLCVSGGSDQVKQHMYIVLVFTALNKTEVALLSVGVKHVAVSGFHNN